MKAMLSPTGILAALKTLVSRQYGILPGADASGGIIIKRKSNATGSPLSLVSELGAATGFSVSDIAVVNGRQFTTLDGLTTLANASLLLNTGIIRQWAHKTRLTTSPTNNTTTFANITDLSAPLITGRNYTGRMVWRGTDSTAAEGVKFDFAGGSATFSNFWAAAHIITSGAVVAGTLISTSLSGVINWSTITGDTFIQIDFSGTCNGSGTFIPRTAQNSHASGTLTNSLGTYIDLNESIN